jgi:hypothetical protein
MERLDNNKDDEIFFYDYNYLCYKNYEISFVIIKFQREINFFFSLL